MEFGVQRQTDDEKQAQNFNNLNESQDKKVSGCCGFLSVEYYQPYFQVTEQDVIARIKATFLPFRPDFLNQIQGNPDLWGPIWISATLVFLITAAANISQFNAAQPNYNISYVPKAAALLYCISFGTPVILTIVMKFLGSELGFFHTLCLYGYSMSTLIPITLLCPIQFSLIQWLLVSYGVINTTMFLIFNLKDELDKLEIQKKYIIMGVILAMQVSLYMIYKLVFFKVISTNDSIA